MLCSVCKRCHIWAQGNKRQGRQMTPPGSELLNSTRPEKERKILSRMKKKIKPEYILTVRVNLLIRFKVFFIRTFIFMLYNWCIHLHVYILSAWTWGFAAMQHITHWRRPTDVLYATLFLSRTTKSDRFRVYGLVLMQRTAVRFVIFQSLFRVRKLWISLVPTLERCR